ncbi:MAG: class I SAM-dependent methyltransferase [Cyclobacteriaceae bacterium]
MKTENIKVYRRVADQKRLEFIINNIEKYIPEDGTILDVGCGNGVISSALGEVGFQVRGIDVSEKTIETARLQCELPNVQFDCVSAEALKLEQKKYDAIVCSEVLEHLDDPSPLLASLYEALSEDGILIVTVPNGNGPREAFVTRPVLRLRNNGGWLWKQILRVKQKLGYSGTTVQSDADNLDHVQFFSKNDLEQLSKTHQFEITDFKNSNFLEEVFPISIVSRKLMIVQKIDCFVADLLPHFCTSGFLTVWKKGH